MITEKEYIEAKMIIKLYEIQLLNKSGIVGIFDKMIPPPPSPPEDRYLKEEDEPPKPKNFQ